MISNRTCMIAGHDLQISHVCLFQNYDQQSRWLCQKCNNQKIHNHGSEIQDQIVSMKQFEKMMIEKKYTINRTYDQIGNILAVSIILSKNLKSMMEFVGNLQKQKYSNAAWLKLNEIKDFTQLYLLESETIEQLVIASRDLNYSQDLMNQVSILKVEINKFEQISNNLNELNKKDQKTLTESMILQDLSKVKHKFNNKNIKSLNQNQIFQLILYKAGGNFHLTIWNHQTLLVLHQFQLLNQINMLKFTSDSQTLFVSSQDGYVYQFLPESHFKIFCDQEFINHVKQMFMINNNIIITCDKNEIRKTDCSKSEILLILKTSAMDFDYDISRNYLLTNHTQNVCLWNGKFGYVVMEKKFEKLLNSGIRFVGNFTQILVNFIDTGFHQYNIDLNNKTFELIRSILNNDKLRILSFSLTQKQQFIVLFDKDIMEIRSFSGIVIQTINHELKFNDQQYKNIEQVELMKTLIVTNGIQIKLFKVI